MSGKKARALRRAFGDKTTRYKKAKHQYATFPTLFAQGVLTIAPRPAASVRGLS